MKLSILSILSLAATALCASRTSPPAGCIVVSKSATSGQFSTVQAAVDSLSTTASGTQCIFIYQGTYAEQVYVPARTAQLTLYGYTTNTTGYTANTVTITQGKSQDDSANNDLTATLRAHAAGLKVYNLNLANTRGKGSQALAVSAQATKQGYYGCQFTGYQDTILSNEGVQVFAASLVVGATDFIFGQRARTWFTKLAIRINGAGYITANGRDSETNESYYVITDSDVALASGITLGSGSTYLGRPWRNYSRVVVQRSSLSSVVNGAGWVQWGATTPQTDHVFYKEFANTGAGAAGTRASFAGTLEEAVGIAEILGSDYASWVDAAYI
ncbi:carbohydrate esterase family 8 protein [Geopyxis carbonaria]|nr:carbohydrate esterase family 8 protein [Geopyxis carbonaria]